MTANLVEVHKTFGDRVGRDVFFLSITLDSAVDTPAKLRDYRRSYGHDWKGWLHLTGDHREIEALRRTLGVYDLDPVIDADRTQHAGIATFGNDRTDWWAAVPALMIPEEIAETVVRLTAERPSPFARSAGG